VLSSMRKLSTFPGDHYHKVIDFLTAKRLKLWRKVVLALVIAPTEGNQPGAPVSTRYLADQLATVKKLWVAVIKAKRVRVDRVILFASKSDLFEDRSQFEDHLSAHRQAIKGACRDAGIPFSSITGSAVKRDGLAELMRLLMKRGKS
jgi:hypothetical protein